MFDKLLVALDGSECADHALDAALVLACAEGSKLTLCSVADPSPVYGALQPPVVVEATLAEIHEGARRVADAGLARAGAAGVGASAGTVEGDPAFQIVRRTEEVGAGAIVVGTHGRSGLKRLFMGSVAEGVLRSATVPVIAVRENARILPLDANARLVAPVDGSECSLRALDVAADFAATFGGELLILHVVELGKAAVMSGGQPELVARCIEELRDEGKRIVEEAVERVAGRGRTASRIEDGSAFEIIDRVVADAGPAYIVMGSHGRTGVSRLVIGSVAEGVARSASVPVMVVRVR